jgi:hypothetical protein
MQVTKVNCFLETTYFHTITLSNAHSPILNIKHLTLNLKLQTTNPKPKL